MPRPAQPRRRPTLIRPAPPTTAGSRRTSAHPSTLHKPRQPSRNPRHSTLYDAIASRCSTHGFIPTHPSQLAYHPSQATTVTPLAALPPEEVLFSRTNAPARYEEDDPYFPTFATMREEERVLGMLPDGELCRALHAYTSAFYAAAAGETRHGRRVDGRGGGDWRSMDETALLALGILVEEMEGWVLERNGGGADGVLVEGERREERGLGLSGERVL